MPWTCTACTLENPGRRRRCQLCHAFRPVETAREQRPVKEWLRRRSRRSDKVIAPERHTTIRVQIRCDNRISSSNKKKGKTLNALVDKSWWQDFATKHSESSINTTHGNTDFSTENLRSDSTKVTAIEQPSATIEQHTSLLEDEKLPSDPDDTRLSTCSDENMPLIQESTTPSVESSATKENHTPRRKRLKPTPVQQVDQTTSETTPNVTTSEQQQKTNPSPVTEEPPHIPTTTIPQSAICTAIDSATKGTPSARSNTFFYTPQSQRSSQEPSQETAATPSSNTRIPQHNSPMAPIPSEGKKSTGTAGLNETSDVLPKTLADWKTPSRAPRVSFGPATIEASKRAHAYAIPGTVKRCKYGPSSVSFTSAGNGREIKVSVEALDKAGRLLEETDDAPTEHIRSRPRVSFGNVNDSSTGSSVSFTSAGMGRPIRVSAEALEKAGRLLAGDGSLNPDTPTTTEPTQSPSRVSLGSVNDSSSRLPVAFASAGKGREIKVSAEALSKASRLLEEKDDTPTTTEPIQSRPRVSFGHVDSRTRPSVSFTSAGNGREIKVSVEALDKAGRLLEETDDAPTEPIRSRPRVSFGNVNDSSTGSSVSFTSAGMGRPIRVSAEALEKAGRLLAGDGSLNPDTPTTTEPTQSPSRVSLGSVNDSSSRLPVAFASAGKGREIKVSAEALSKASRLLEEKDDTPTTTEPIQSRPSVSFGHVDSRTRPSVSFTSAGNGREIKVSAEALNKAGRLLEGDGSLTDDVPAVTEPSRNIPRVSFGNMGSSIRPPVSFASAGKGRAIRVSAEALEKAGRFFGEMDDTPTTTEPIRSLSRVSFDNIDGNGARPSVSFASAEMGREIKVSAEALDKAGRLLEDKADTPTSTEIPPSHSHISVGNVSVPTASFASAGKGRGIEVSAGALHKAGRLLGDVCSLADPVETSLESTNLDLAEDDYQGELATELGQDEGMVDTVEAAITNVPRSCPVEEKRRSEIVSPMSSGISFCNALRVRFCPSSLLPLESRDTPTSEAVGSISDYASSLTDRGCIFSSVSTKKWISTHVQMIVWKLACLERHFDIRRLTYGSVVDRLVRRFEVEIADGRRSALRKVLNRDVSASAMIIVFVAQILDSSSGSETTSRGRRLLLSDGWYCITAVVDDPLESFIQHEKIKVGTKLLVSDSELLGCEDGCDPLDESFDPTTNSPTLKIHANTTRIAGWRSKLGFCAYGCGRLLTKELSHVIIGGGRLQSIDLRVVDVEPLRYFCKLKDIDGQSDHGGGFFLSEKEEFLRRKKLEKEQVRLAEKFAEEKEQQVASSVDALAPSFWTESRLKSFSTQEAVESLSAEEQLELARWEERRSSLIQDRLRHIVDARLKDCESDQMQSVPLLKACVSSPNEPGVKASLTIWRPTEDQIEMMKAGATVQLNNVQVKDQRFQGSLQLTANASTTMEASPFGRKPKETCSSGFLSVFRLRQLARDPGSRKKVNFWGFVLHYSTDGCTFNLYLSDRSGIGVRVIGNCDMNEIMKDVDQKVLPGLARDDFAFVAFSKVVVRNCQSGSSFVSVLLHDESAMTVDAVDSDRVRHQHTWARSEAGRDRLVQVARSIGTGVPLISSLGCQVIFGYIYGFLVKADQRLLVKVDTGGREIHVWSLPLSLLGCLDETKEAIALDKTEEDSLTQLRSIGISLRARRTLYRFSLLEMEDTIEDAGSILKVISLSPVPLEQFGKYYEWIHAFDACPLTNI